MSQKSNGERVQYANVNAQQPLRKRQVKGRMNAMTSRGKISTGQMLQIVLRGVMPGEGRYEGQLSHVRKNRSGQLCTNKEYCYACNIKGHRTNEMVCPEYRRLVGELRRMKTPQPNYNAN